MRDRELRAPERAQERRHRLQMTEGDRHALLPVAQAQERPLRRERFRRARGLPPVITRVIHDGIHHLVVAGAAGGADFLAVRAVGYLRLAQCPHSRLPQVRLGHLAVDVIEGQRLALALLPVGEEAQPDSMAALRLGKTFLPDVEIEVLGPAVEALSASVRVQHRGREPPIAQRQSAFQSALPRIVRLHVQVAVAAPEPPQLLAQERVLPLRLLQRDHRIPLERRERLGTEGGDADVDLRPRVRLLSPAKRVGR